MLQDSELQVFEWALLLIDCSPYECLYMARPSSTHEDEVPTASGQHLDVLPSAGSAPVASSAAASGGGFGFGAPASQPSFGFGPPASGAATGGFGGFGATPASSSATPQPTTSASLFGGGGAPLLTSPEGKTTFHVNVVVSSNGQYFLLSTESKSFKLQVSSWETTHTHASCQEAVVLHIHPGTYKDTAHILSLHSSRLPYGPAPWGQHVFKNMGNPSLLSKAKAGGSTENPAHAEPVGG
jgi:hypothetical protein